MGCRIEQYLVNDQGGSHSQSRETDFPPEFASKRDNGRWSRHLHDLINTKVHDAHLLTFPSQVRDHPGSLRQRPINFGIDDLACDAANSPGPPRSRACY